MEQQQQQKMTNVNQKYFKAKDFVVVVCFCRNNNHQASISMREKYQTGTMEWEMNE